MTKKLYCIILKWIKIYITSNFFWLISFKKNKSPQKFALLFFLAKKNLDKYNLFFNYKFETSLINSFQN